MVVGRAGSIRSQIRHRRETPSRGLGRWRLRAAKSFPDVAGSGDKQAEAKLCCVEIDKVAVAFGPPT
jgi:hypothetical protein